MTLVAGVDSSTQSCKVVVRDAETGRLVREGRAAHPDGTEVHPSHWWSALQSALADAGGLSDVAALSVAGQQHGMVCLDEAGEVVREALLWNDTRSAAAAASLTDELGAAEWAARIGLVPVASFTITKLRWLAQHEPANARRTAAVCLPHDWLTWRLRGTGLLSDLVTDRSDASGTGYFDSVANAYVPDLLSLALGRSDVVLPQVLGPAEWRDGPSRLGLDAAGRRDEPSRLGSGVGGQRDDTSRLAAGAGPRRDETVRLGAGAGDNAAAMLGVGGGTDVVVSLGTSGVVTATSEVRAADASGIVAGFADATGRYLPLACTLNAARVLDATARMLGVDLTRLSDLALSAKPGAEGVVMVPYLEGERTPNLPDASGALHGLTLTNATPANIARAAVEGMLCGLAVGLDALSEQGADVTGVRLVGGAAVSPAVREIAPMVFGVPVTVPAPDEYVANGAARQAAWTLTGGATPPEWTLAESTRYEAEAVPEIRARYGDAAQRYLSR